MLSTFTSSKRVQIRDWRLAWLNVAMMSALGIVIIFNIYSGMGRKMSYVHTEATMDLRGTPLRSGDYQGTIPNLEHRTMHDQRCAPTGLYELRMSANKAAVCSNRLSRTGFIGMSDPYIANPGECLFEYGETVRGLMVETPVTLEVGTRIKVLDDKFSFSSSAPKGTSGKIEEVNAYGDALVRFDNLLYPIWVSWSDCGYLKRSHGENVKATVKALAGAKVDDEALFEVWKKHPHVDMNMTDGFWTDDASEFHFFDVTYEGKLVLVLSTAQELETRGSNETSVQIVRRDGSSATGTFVAKNQIAWSGCPDGGYKCVWYRPAKYTKESVPHRKLGEHDEIVALSVKNTPLAQAMEVAGKNTKQFVNLVVNGSAMSVCRRHNRDDYTQIVRRLDRERLLLTSTIEYQRRPLSWEGEDTPWNFFGYDQIAGNLEMAVLVIAAGVPGVSEEDGFVDHGTIETCSEGTGMCWDKRSIELTTNNWLGMNSTHLYLKVSDLINRTEIDLRRCVDYSRCVLRIDIEMHNHLWSSWKHAVLNGKMPTFTGYGEIHYVVKISNSATDVLTREVEIKTINDQAYQVMRIYSGLVVALSVQAKLGRVDYKTFFAYFGSTVGVIFASSKAVDFIATNVIGRRRHQLYKTFLTEVTPDLHDIEEYAKENHNGDVEKTLAELAMVKLRQQLTIGSAEFWKYERNVDKLLESFVDKVHSHRDLESIDDARQPLKKE